MLNYNEIIEKLEIAFYNHINRFGVDPKAIIMHPITLDELRNNSGINKDYIRCVNNYYRGVLIYRSEDCHPNLIIVS